MNSRGRLAGVAVLLALGLLGAGAVLAGTGTGSEVIGSLLDDGSQPPALVNFEAAGARCTDEFVANSSSSVVARAENTQITHTRNVSLPDPSYAIGNPTFERVNETTYVLAVPIEETDKAPRECPGVARYNATMRIPTGDDPWHLIIKHDGETVTTLTGDSNSTLLGGSASVAQSVSGNASSPPST